LGDAAVSAPVGLQIAEKAVRLLAFKRSENAPDALTLRVAEICGGQTSVTVTLPFAVAKAQFADGREQPTGEAVTVQGNTLRFALPALGCATVVITPAQATALPDRPVQPYGARVLCSFTAEHTDTVVCVEKEALGGSFSITEDGTPIARVECDGFYKQFVRLQGLHTGVLAAKRVEE